jgi:hypothetical protein
MRRSWLFALALPALASYQYYVTDPPTSIDPSRWGQNGAVTATSIGLTSADSNGGSLISRVAVPDGSTQYEVKATLALNSSGGTYVLYLRTSPDALSGPNTSSGTYYAFEIQNPTFTGTDCSATLIAYMRTGGTVTQWGQTVIPCRNGMQLHAVFDAYNGINLYLDGICRMFMWDSTITAGQPGVGVRDALSANSISLVETGPHRPGGAQPPQRAVRPRGRLSRSCGYAMARGHRRRQWHRRVGFSGLSRRPVLRAEEFQ